MMMSWTRTTCRILCHRYDSSARPCVIPMTLPCNSCTCACQCAFTSDTSGTITSAYRKSSPLYPLPPFVCPGTRRLIPGSVRAGGSQADLRQHTPTAGTAAPADIQLVPATSVSGPADHSPQLYHSRRHSRAAPAVVQKWLLHIFLIFGLCMSDFSQFCRYH
jgi:hypothetical protein